ncbi:hypothetical protein [Peribacillus sp. NPDC058075]|uniref:hypothetical protein n=1 Tax=unclassified Peribacillus TaxID=2675266 RepID=UPI0036DA4B2A
MKTNFECFINNEERLILDVVYAKTDEKRLIALSRLMESKNWYEDCDVELSEAEEELLRKIELLDED